MPLSFCAKQVHLSCISHAQKAVEPRIAAAAEASPLQLLLLLLLAPGLR